MIIETCRVRTDANGNAFVLRDGGEREEQYDLLIDSDREIFDDDTSMSDALKELIRLNKAFDILTQLQNPEDLQRLDEHSFFGVVVFGILSELRSGTTEPNDLFTVEGLTASIFRALQKGRYTFRL